jgi:hypothetical protein
MTVNDSQRLSLNTKDSLACQGFFRVYLEPVKKEKQLSFRAEPDLARQLEAWAVKEDLPTADFIRKLLRISAGLYHRHGSLHALRQAAAVVPSSHSPEQPEHVTKEELLDRRVKLGADIIREHGPKEHRAAKKPHRTKAS